jgi:hypothetical protein
VFIAQKQKALNKNQLKTLQIMKKINKVLIFACITGLLLGIAGVIVSIMWLGNPDCFFVLSLVLSIGSITGLVMYNFSKIKTSLFK